MGISFCFVFLLHAKLLFLSLSCILFTNLKWNRITKVKIFFVFFFFVYITHKAYYTLYRIRPDHIFAVCFNFSRTEEKHFSEIHTHTHIILRKLWWQWYQHTAINNNHLNHRFRKPHTPPPPAYLSSPTTTMR